MSYRMVGRALCALLVLAGAVSAPAQNKNQGAASREERVLSGSGVTLNGNSIYAASPEYTDVYYHKNRAYIGSLTTPGHVHIADPVTTNLLGTYNTSNSSFVRDLQVQGNLLYVALDQGGFDIVDISNPASPTLVKFFNTSFPFGVHDLFIHGSILYAVEDVSGSNLHIIDVSDPAAPVRLTVFDNPGGCHDITLVGNRAYLANLGGGFQILDVTNPAAPVALLTKNYTNAFTHNIWPSGDGRYVATTDETCGSGFLRIWDVQNPTNVVQVGAYIVPNMGNTCVHNAMWVDNFIYMSYYNHGLRIVDVTNPMTPTEVAFWDTYNGQRHRGGDGENKGDGSVSHEGAIGCFDGAWGVYAERSGPNSTMVTISDITSGLWSFTFPSAPNLAIQGPGIYHSQSGTFFLRNTNSSGGADATVTFGPGGSLVGLVGDWDGNGSKTLGVFDAATSVFFLRNSNTPGGADLTVPFGPPGAGWIPVVGDWDGNDTETVGLFDPASGTYFLRNANSPGPASLTFTFGPGGGVSTPVVGDWDNSGDDTVGVFLGSSSTFFLRNANSAGAADATFSFGAANPANVAVVGNWDGVGGDSVAVYSRTSGTFFGRNDNAVGPADLTYSFGPGGAGFAPMAGDWTGPGH